MVKIIEMDTQKADKCHIIDIMTETGCIFNLPLFKYYSAFCLSTSPI